MLRRWELHAYLRSDGTLAEPPERFWSMRAVRKCLEFYRMLGMDAMFTYQVVDRRKLLTE